MPLRTFASGSVPPVPTVPCARTSVPPAHPFSRAFTAPVIPPMIYQSNLQPAQDQPILQTVKRTLHLDGSDDEASALKKFLSFQYPRKSKMVDMQSWSTNPSRTLSSKKHLSRLSEKLMLFAKTLSGNDKGICRQIVMEGLASVLDDGDSQTNITNKDIVRSIQQFVVAGNKKGGNINTQALQAREAVISACKSSVTNDLEKVRTAIGVSKRIFYKKMKTMGLSVLLHISITRSKKDIQGVQNFRRNLLLNFVTQMRVAQLIRTGISALRLMAMIMPPEFGMCSLLMSSMILYVGLSWHRCTQIGIQGLKYLANPSFIPTGVRVSLLLCFNHVLI